MARKVFLSFLGTSNYQVSKYYVDNTENFVETRFVQIASCKFHCWDFDENDKVFIFTTDKAKSRNWYDDFEFNKPCSDEIIKNKGLQTELVKNGIKPKISDETAIWIPEESSEEKIWETFKIVFDHLEPEDEIVFDITHGFRSSPMLLMVLINYAKFLKKITVRKIVYGAFEARSNENETKLWDLTNFAVLQDWTNGANEFMNFGGTTILAEVANKEISIIRNNSKGNGNEVKTYSSLINQISNLTESISTVRGYELYEGKRIEKINNLLSELHQNNLFQPLTPILLELKTKLQSFKKDNIWNLFEIANFCIQNNQLQQAITFLQEAIISFAIYKCNMNFATSRNNNFVEIRELRELVSSVFNFKDNKENPNFIDEKWNWKNHWNKNHIEMFINDGFIQETSKIYSKIGKYRNDINHGGLINPKNSKDFKKLLFDVYPEIVKIVKKYLELNVSNLKQQP